MVEPQRVQVLSEKLPAAGRYVLYWVQASQRSAFNPALEYAIDLANSRDEPVIVCFGLMDDYPEANTRHYAFMLEGLSEVAVGLEKRGIKFVCGHGSPPEVALRYAEDASIVVCDRGYLRHQRAWRDEVADRAGKQVVQVEGNVVVPVEEVSEKHEFAARTIRPKIHRLWEKYLVPLKALKVKHPSTAMRLKGDLDVSDPEKLLGKLKLDRSVPPSTHFHGGEDEARKRLARFVDATINGYDEGRNEPAANATSHLSPYLHFGMISPVEVALAAKASKTPQADREAYIEELIIRRELSMNFCQFHPKYDRYECLPEWCRKTLHEHAGDKREYVYSLANLEAAKTHDPYWNAAQLEMVRTGFMHNYMRMYWGKKVLEWTSSPERAFAAVLHLNNKYFIDGRDPNSFANVAWIFGLHDRPWTERKIFGTIRYMNAAGLERKFDIDAYVERIARMK